MTGNVRNFWIEAEVDGRKTPIAFGPQGKDGGFHLILYMRNKGEVEEVVWINGEAIHERTLTLYVECKNERCVTVHRDR